MAESTQLPSREKLEVMHDLDLMNLAREMELNDVGCQDRKDIVERMLLTCRKQDGTSHNPFDKFGEIFTDEKATSSPLQSILQTLSTIFEDIYIGPLSEVLMTEKLLKDGDLKTELSARLKALQKREIKVIVAGETNGGKSTFLNLYLGQNILPTDVMHCTFAICKIKYGETYKIEALKHNGDKEVFPLQNAEKAREMLKTFVAEESMIARQEVSMYKEITLYMPSPVLRSGVTLVDTPGIGEGEAMDSVTFDYISANRASAFIYVIKSDAAGGIQESKLVKFLQAIQDDYRQSSVEGAIDPRAALFICNRWDAISANGVEKVKKNALVKLDLAWPGFEKNQLYFFSSLRARRHLDADPKFVTDEFNDLMMGLKRLCQIASINDVHLQYWWTKYFVQLASRHLSSMINHCNQSQEEQTDLFQQVAAKQETLMSESTQNVHLLQDALNSYHERLKQVVYDIFSSVQPTDLEDYFQLVSIISTTDFLKDSANKDVVNPWVVSSLIFYCDKQIQHSGILEDIETDAKQKIKEHIGLHEAQIKDITDLVKGKPGHLLGDSEGSSISSLGSSCQSITSLCNTSFNLNEMGKNKFMDFTQLNKGITHYMEKRKKSGLTKLLPKAKTKIMSFLHKENGGGSNGRGDKNPIATSYLDSCIQKNASKMKETPEIIEGFAAGYLYLIDTYINSAMERIPHFIEVNKQVMEEIRDNRKALLEDKKSMRKVMHQLEPCRDLLRGLGSLCIEDLNADLIDFNVEKRNSSVNFDTEFSKSTRRPFDSGFSETGSTQTKAFGFWTSLKKATIGIDYVPHEVMVKKYTCKMDRNVLLKEIASLRCLEHTNLAPFFGMARIRDSEHNENDEESDSSEKVSAFIFKGSLVSAHIYKRNKLILKKEFIRKFLQGLFAGLEFIHQEKLVHMELNLNTIMVNSETGVVQLCQQCSPRKVELPSDLSIQTGQTICLSPAVLQGEVYGICDDIYAFALLLWELLYPKRLPFTEQRQWPLEKFIAEVNPAKMLAPELEALNPSPKVDNVLKGALLNRKGQLCIAMMDIKRLFFDLMKSFESDGYVQSCHDEPAFKNTRQTPVKKVPRVHRQTEMTNLLKNIGKEGSDDSSIKEEPHEDIEDEVDSVPVLPHPTLDETSTLASAVIAQPSTNVSHATSSQTGARMSRSRKASLPNLMALDSVHEQSKSRIRKMSMPQILVMKDDQEDHNDFGSTSSKVERSIAILLKKFDPFNGRCDSVSSLAEPISSSTRPSVGRLSPTPSHETSVSHNKPTKNPKTKFGQRLLNLFKLKKSDKSFDLNNDIDTGQSVKHNRRRHSEPCIALESTPEEKNAVSSSTVHKQGISHAGQLQKLMPFGKVDSFLPQPMLSEVMEDVLSSSGSWQERKGTLETIHSQGSSLKNRNQKEENSESDHSINNSLSSSNVSSEKEPSFSKPSQDSISDVNQSGICRNNDFTNMDSFLDTICDESSNQEATPSRLSSFRISSAFPSLSMSKASGELEEHFQQPKSDVTFKNDVSMERKIGTFATPNVVADMKGIGITDNPGNKPNQDEPLPDIRYSDFNYDLSLTAYRSSERRETSGTEIALPSLRGQELFRDENNSDFKTETSKISNDIMFSDHKEDNFSSIVSALPSISSFTDTQNDDPVLQFNDDVNFPPQLPSVSGFETLSALPVVDSTGQGGSITDSGSGSMSLGNSTFNREFDSASASKLPSISSYEENSISSLDLPSFQLPLVEGSLDNSSRENYALNNDMPVIVFDSLSFMDV